ncbi:MAG: tRNA (adenosine(37)-N6)-dimethylallyltransferase MiaA [Desulfovibrionaceae bacterium]
MKPVRIVCILGPTGTGKTRAALSLGQSVEVVNFDSRQVYADFPIITAQPSSEELSCAPHHLYGFLACDQSMNAARMAELAADAIQEIHARGNLPVLVGGTGLYLRVLLEGIAPIPDIPEAVRRSVLERLQREGPQALHREVVRVDPAYAAVIHENDSQRNARALEVWLGTGRTLSDWHAEARPAFPLEAFKIGVRVDLDELTPRLAARIDEMLDMGALEEAREALAKCPDPKAPGWSGIGCAELLAHLRGEISLERARDIWERNTRAYAKRQLTWCRKERDLNGFEAGDFMGMAQAVGAWLKG